MPIRHSKMATRPDVVIEYIAEEEPGITGQYLSATRAGVAITLEQAFSYTEDEQAKNLALSRLNMRGLYNPASDPQSWEIKNGKVNFIVPSRDTEKVTQVLDGLRVTVNG